MNKDRLDEIKKRTALLPAGEYKTTIDDEGVDWIKMPDHHAYCIGDLEDTDQCCYILSGFVVNAFKDVPALIEHVDNMQMKINYMEGLLSRVEWMEFHNFTTPEKPKIECPFCGYPKSLGRHALGCYYAE